MEGQDYGDDDDVFRPLAEDIFLLNPALALVERFYFPETWLWHLQPIGLVGFYSMTNYSSGSRERQRANSGLMTLSKPCQSSRVLKYDFNL